jgi:hypothetical protein
MMTVTEWMKVKFQSADARQQQGFALATAQYVDQFQTIAREMIDQANAAQNADEMQKALTVFVKRCDFSAEHLHQTLLALSGEPHGMRWPAKN